MHKYIDLSMTFQPVIGQSRPRLLLQEFLKWLSNKDLFSVLSNRQATAGMTFKALLLKIQFIVFVFTGTSRFCWQRWHPWPTWSSRPTWSPWSPRPWRSKYPLQKTIINNRLSNTPPSSAFNVFQWH